MKLWYLGLTAISLALAALLASCDGGGGESLNDLLSRAPDIRGRITSASPADGGELLGSLVIDDQISVRITENTHILRFVGFQGEDVQGSFDDLTVGERVEVWVVGQLAEASPMPARALLIYVPG